MTDGLEDESRLVAEIIDLTADDEEEKEKDIVNVPAVNTEFGMLESAQIIESRFVGLRLTKPNTQLLFDSLETADQVVQLARRLLDTLAPDNHLMKMRETVANDDDLLIITDDALKSMERKWTGYAGTRIDGSTDSARYFARIVSCTFAEYSWNLIREVSYIAIAEDALDALVNHARYEHGMAQSRTEIARIVDQKCLEDAIDCLRAGNQRQNVMAALSCAASAWRALPPRMPPDRVPASDCIGFMPIQQHPFRDRVYSFPCARFWSKSITYQRSILFQSEKREKNGSQYLAGDNKQFPYASLDNLVVSGSGAILVEGVALRSKWGQKNICLYLLDAELQMNARDEVATIVQDLLQGPAIYHTLLHSGAGMDKRDPEEILWNLPRVGWPCDKQVRFLIDAWIRELRGNESEKGPSKLLVPAAGPFETERCSLLKSMFQSFKKGKTYEEALEVAKEIIQTRKSSQASLE